MGKASQEEATCRVKPQTGLPGGLTSSFSAGKSPGNLLHLELRERNHGNKIVVAYYVLGYLCPIELSVML